MANTSIFNAFERMWQHTIVAINDKLEEVTTTSPYFDLNTDFGLPAITMDGNPVSVFASMEELYSAAYSGAIRIGFLLNIDGENYYTTAIINTFGCDHNGVVGRQAVTHFNLNGTNYRIMFIFGASDLDRATITAWCEIETAAEELADFEQEVF